MDDRVVAPVPTYGILVFLLTHFFIDAVFLQLFLRSLIQQLVFGWWLILAKTALAGRISAARVLLRFKFQLYS